MPEILFQLYMKKKLGLLGIILLLPILTPFFSSLLVLDNVKERDYDKTNPSSNLKTYPQTNNNVNLLKGNENNENENSAINYEDEEETEDDEDDDTIDDDVESANERELEIEVQESEVQIESKLKNDEKKDEISLEFKVDDEISFEIQYKSETDVNELDLEFTIKFHSLVEYIDSNSDDKFQTETDQVLQEIEFESLDFLPIQHIIQQVQNVSVYIFSVTNDNGLFSLKFYLLEEFGFINQSLITPTEIKIDIEINEFSFSQSNSRLALKILLEAEGEYEYDDETEDEHKGRTSNEAEVEITTNNFTGFFSWGEFVQVDGKNQTVVVSSIEIDDDDSDNQKIYFNYPQGIRIIHDPKIGIEGILIPPIIPTEAIENFLTILKLSKEEYLLVVTVFSIMIIVGMLFYRKRYS